jgi:ABC-type dipeptide/oligopeptide/nickel transport system permease component
MFKYFIKRLLLLIPVVLGVSVLVFIIMHVFTTDPSANILGQHASKEQIDALRQQLGLNDPLYKQYLTFITGILQGDFGTSLITKSSVATEIFSRFPATIELAIISIIVASIVGITLGVLSAVKQNSIIDYLCMGTSLVGVSMPIFWLGLILIVVFSVTLGWLPVSGRATIGMEPAKITGLYLLDSLLSGDMAAFFDSLEHLVLPVIALSSYSTAIIARMTRSAMLEVLGQDYIRTAKSKGLVESIIIRSHGLRNTLIPVTTVIGLQLGSLLGGAVLTETVFSWPGIGSYTIDAILKSDFPVVQGAVMIMAIVFVLVNLLVDLLYAFIDPRIKYS